MLWPVSIVACFRHCFKAIQQMLSASKMLFLSPSTRKISTFLCRMKGIKFCQLTYGFDKAGMMHTSNGTKINMMDWILSGFQAIWFGDQILSYITSECGWRKSA